MSRRSNLAMTMRWMITSLIVCLVVVGSFGCEELDGRNRTRAGNRMFRETRFIDAVAEYEKALKTVNDPIVHYNLGLAYSKVFKPGVEKPLRLGLKGSFACDAIPSTKTVAASVCVKEDDDRRYEDCDAKNVCASSYQCKQVELCTLEGAQLAEAAATHFQGWLKANPKDDDTRKQMTQVWLDSGQFKLAIDYWTGLLAAKPNDSEIMGNLAGINLKSGDWRTSIEWYLKVASVALDEAKRAREELEAVKGDADKRKAAEAKVAAAEGKAVGAYQFIGNVAWSKLNSKTLPSPEAFELADKGIGALQLAAEISPKNAKLWSLQGSIYTFRALAQGASWAASLDRASAQDLQRFSRVLAVEAKKAQDAAAGASQTPSPIPGGPAEKAGG